MCIIVAKNKGVALPSNDILYNCFRSNDDGVGIAYAYNNKLHLKKGIMTYKELINYLDGLKKELQDDELKNVSMLLHFRIGTSGGINKEKTHPFLISNKYKQLNKLQTDDANLVMVHNGVLSDYTYIKELSDTQTFIKDVIYPIYQHDKEFYKKDYINNLLYRIIGDNNKLAFLDSDGIIKLINKKAFIKDNGVYYSNSSYLKLEKYYNNYGWYKDYDYDYDYDYEYTYNSNYDTYNSTTNTISKKNCLPLFKDDIIYNEKNNTYLEIKQDDVYVLDDTTDKLYRLTKQPSTYDYYYFVELVDTNVHLL